MSAFSSSEWQQTVRRLARTASRVQQQPVSPAVFGSSLHRWRGYTSTERAEKIHLLAHRKHGALPVSADALSRHPLLPVEAVREAVETPTRFLAWCAQVPPFGGWEDIPTLLWLESWLCAHILCQRWVGSDANARGITCTASLVPSGGYRKLNVQVWSERVTTLDKVTYCRPLEQVVTLTPRWFLHLHDALIEETTTGYYLIPRGTLFHYDSVWHLIQRKGLFADLPDPATLLDVTTTV